MEMAYWSSYSYSFPGFPYIDIGKSAGNEVVFRL